MGLDLFNTTVLSTYDSLIKVGDNDTLTGIPKLLSDGRGNDTPIWLSTNSLGIGVTPESGYTFQVSGLTKLSTVTITSNVTANSFIKSGGLSSQFLKADGSVDSNTYQSVHQKGLANGYAPLDGGAKISEAYLPDSIVGQLEYQGTWNATTNTPTLPSASTVKGHYYVTSVAGTYQTIEYAVGDWVISNGTSWEKVDNTDAVTTVFGRIGAIVANSGDYSSFYHPLNGDLAANASTATTLQTAKFINGTSFNGSANITTAIWGSSRTITIGDTAKSLNGSINVAWSRAELGITKVNIDALNIDADTLDGIDSTGFVKQLGITSSPNYQTPSSSRVNPNVLNPTNEHYAITTFGNGGNVTGQLATHFVYGDLYSRAYNSNWSNWKKYWNDTDFTSVNVSNWNTAYGWGDWSTGVNKTFVDALNVDADTLDNLNSTQFLRSDTSDTMSGTLNITGSLAIGKTTAPATTLDINGGILANGNIATSAGQMSASGGNSTQWTSAYSFTNGFSIGNYYTPLDDRYFRRFQGTATGVSNAGFTTAFTVDGGNLASSIRFSVQGTTGSVVVSNLVDLIVNHHQDIMIKSLSGIYTKLTLKVVSNDNEDFAVELKTNHANPVNLYIEVLCYGAETVTFTNTHSYTGSTLEKELPAGEFISGTGGNQGNSVIDGNVGIGTSNPSQKLDVSGVIAINGTKMFSTIGSTSYIWNNTSSLYVVDDTGNNVQLSIKDNGNVGIGTSSPSEKLEVTGGVIRLNSNSGGFYQYNTAGAFRSAFYDDGSTTRIYGDGNGSTAAIVINSNSVGIGTTTPSYKLDVSGGSGFRDTLRIVSGSTETVQLSWTGSNTGVINALSGGSIGVQILGSGNTYFNGGNVCIGATSPRNKLDVALTGAEMVYPIATGTNPTGGFRIGHTDTAWAGVELNMGIANASAQGYPAWIQAQNPADLSVSRNLLLNPNGGNVGIGTTAPSNKLSLAGSGQTWNTSPAIKMWDSFNSKGWYVGSANNASIGDFYIRSVTAENSYPDSTTQQFTIKQNGNVGIGTISPVSPIDVVSAANATGITLRGRSADNIGTFNFSDNAGNVSSQIQDRNGQFHITTLDTSPILFNTAASERMRIDSSGSVIANVDMRAPIFYDSNNTAFYVDPNSTSRFNKIQTSSSGATPRYDTAFYVIQGQHWYGDTGSQIMYLGESGNDVLLRGQMSIGTISISAAYALTMGGHIDMNNSQIDYASQLHFNDNVRFYQDGNDSYLNFKYGDASAGGIKFLRGDGTIKGYVYADNAGFGLLDNDGAWALRTRTGTSPLSLYCDGNEEFLVYTSYTYSPGSSRAPIFYDSDNTAYYVDPAGTSVVSKIVGAEFTGRLKNGGTGPNTENLNTIADAVTVGQLEYRGYNSSSSNKPPAVDNANGVITVGQHSGLYTAQLAFSSDGNMYWRDNPSTSYGSWRKIWESGNDGSGSGLDADLLDGQQGSYYQPVNATIPLYRGAITSQDWNSYIDGTEAGYYQVSNASGSNKPPAYNYGTELNFSVSGANKLQIYAPHNGTDGNGVWIRTGWSGDYDAWREVAMYGMAPYSGGDLRASIFYDSDNTGYYVDPSSTSRMFHAQNAYGSEYIHKKHSGSDFPSGTLVTTDIPSSATNGASFVLDATGKSYSTDTPFSFTAQGYLYADTIINASGLHMGKPGFTQMKVFNNGGTLAFWWPTVSYWNSFEVRVRDAGGNSRNRVTTIVNSTEPSSSKKITITMKVSAVYNQNINVGDFYATAFYDSDNTVYYTNPSDISVMNKAWFAGGISVNSSGSSTSKHGISLFTTSVTGKPPYGMLFTGTPGEGTHGSVTSDWATYFTMSGATSRGWIFQHSATGNVASISGTGNASFNGDVIAYFSDMRLKTKLGNIENPIQKIQSLNGFYYEPNEVAESYGYKKERKLGLSAQEVEAILPEIVTDAPIGDGYKTVDYAKLVPVLIEAIKEQQKQIDELKQLINK